MKIPNGLYHKTGFVGEGKVVEAGVCYAEKKLS